MTRPQRFAFGGDTITAAELARHVPVYDEETLLIALRAGCTSVRAVMMHLAQVEYEARKRHRRGTHKGIAAQRATRKAETERARAGR